MTRKSILFISFIFVFIAGQAQDLKVNLYSGYVFDNSVNSFYSSTSYFRGKIKGGFRWGVGLSYQITPFNALDLSYLRQDTHAPMTYYDNGVKFENFDMAANWILLGGTHSLHTDNLEPYGGGELGMVIFNVKNPSTGSSNSETKFAWGLKLGTNIYITDILGIKLQADLRSAVQGVGGGFFIGTGGPGAGVSTYSSIIQLGLGGGLVFRFGTGNTGHSRNNL